MQFRVSAPTPGLSSDTPNRIQNHKFSKYSCPLGLTKTANGYLFTIFLPAAPYITCRRLIYLFRVAGAEDTRGGRGLPDVPWALRAHSLNSEEHEINHSLMKPIWVIRGTGSDSKSDSKLFSSDLGCPSPPQGCAARRALK